MLKLAKSVGLITTALLLVALGSFIGASLVWLLNDGTYIPTDDKFDIYINILFVTFGMLSVGGLLVYQVIRAALQADLSAGVKKAEEERKSKLALYAGALFHRQAYGHWQESEELWRYYQFRKLEDDAVWKTAVQRRERKRILLYLDLAISEATESLKALRSVTAVREDQEYMQQLTLATTNTLAYVLATKRSAKDLGKALELEAELRRSADLNYYYLETSGWVLMRFGELYPGDDRTERGRQTISAILARSDVEKSLRDSVREKYERCFPNDLELP